MQTATYLGNTHSCFHAGGVIVSETSYTQKVYEGWHYHENHLLSLAVKGGTLEARSGGEREVLPGTVMLYQSGEKHRNRHTRHPSRNINLEIEESFLMQHGLTFSTLRDAPFVKTTLLQIFRESLSAAPFSQTAIASLVLSLFAAPARPAHGPLPAWVPLLRDYLQDQWNETPSLNTLATATGVHPVTISHYFPVYFHCSLGAYLRKIKVEKAISLMQQPELSLTAIAHQCGFFDQSHFIRTFKACTGFLPGEYRKL
ncbi:helix-turn-helix domain-containing protein [Chitinophaga solisilvae]|uniref:helix-turn-helix domain-containing protein n=1 Tax=Chitinophaga solisilvae TaxID=1233460 RepID=UPI00136A2661|nr:AraC family transcriptional regulator [Chitinophaga solisilvae]